MTVKVISAKVKYNQLMNKLDKLIEDLFKRFSAKQKKVIYSRFGLKGERLTLQEIGDSLGITRERVRQIENQCVKKLEPQLKKEFGYLLDDAAAFLKTVGGVRRDDYFLHEIRHISGVSGKNLNNQLRFIFAVAGFPYFYKEDSKLNSFWYKDNKSRERLLKFIREAIDFFNKVGKEKILEEKVHLVKFDNFVFHNYLSISKEFGTNVFGDFGLRCWPEIEPKVVRDKAHIILKKKKTPLHFREIANLINRLGIDNKKMHVQTVHNELIKDDRFVLVGRGMYGLKEHGFEGGTAQEVIRKVLKEKGPLTSKEVVELVSQKKILKRNTILLNLQNRKYFCRLDDGRYYIREA